MCLRISHSHGHIWQVWCGLRIYASIGTWRNAGVSLQHHCRGWYTRVDLITFTRCNRFILTAALGIGFIDIVSPTWFGKILDYSGSNVNLQGFEQGLNLIVETPFIIAAVIGVFLNIVLPEDRRVKEDEMFRDRDGMPMLAGSHN